MSGSEHFIDSLNMALRMAVQSSQSRWLQPLPLSALCCWPRTAAEEVEAFFAPGMKGQSENQDVMLGAPRPAEAASFPLGLSRGVEKRPRTSVPNALQSLPDPKDHLSQSGPRCAVEQPPKAVPGSVYSRPTHWGRCELHQRNLG